MSLFDGVRVLDLSRMLAGPYGSMLLADLGAQVIKIEEPDGGDPMRVMGPPFLPDGESAYFLAINRNKKSLALDLTKPEGRDVFLDLAREADVVWENFRPGVMERLGLAYAALAAVNPRLVMCSISAYGQDGPYRDWPAFDLALQAMGGAMSVTGEDGGPPVRMGLPMGDLAGGMQGTAAILHERFAKRLAGSTESNCIHEFTIARSQARADMALPNMHSIGRNAGDRCAPEQIYAQLLGTLDHCGVQHGSPHCQPRCATGKSGVRRQR